MSDNQIVSLHNCMNLWLSEKRPDGYSRIPDRKLLNAEMQISFPAFTGTRELLSGSWARFPNPGFLGILLELLFLCEDMPVAGPPLQNARL